MGRNFSKKIDVSALWFQSSAASAASGALSSTLNIDFAAPVGHRLPCSQLRIVSSGTSIRAENSAWLNPRRLRTRRANFPASSIAPASSLAACRSRSASVVASSRAASTRPALMDSGIDASIVTRFVLIVLDLTSIGFARRDDSHRIVSRSEDHYKNALTHLVHQLTAHSAAIVMGVGLGQASGVEKDPLDVSESKASQNKEEVALSPDPSKLHEPSVVQCSSSKKPWACFESERNLNEGRLMPMDCVLLRKHWPTASSELQLAGVAAGHTVRQGGSS